jgi:hypothetical protein
MVRAAVCAFGFLFVLVSSRHPGDPIPMATPPIDLTSPVPAADGIEDITPPVPSHEACTLPATPHVPSITAEQASSPGLPAPSAPPYLRRASAQQPPATAAEETHPICLGAIQDTGSGPTARLHTFHVGCATHLYVQQPRPPCPTCRHAWNESSDRTFLNQCQHHGVDLPDRPPPKTHKPRHGCHHLRQPREDSAWRTLAPW